jgi:2-oxoglutarate dehydrogenase E2 component (dihydrolipoamide succinyltransferase)
MAVNIVVPEMGESIVDARIARWLKQEGEPVSVGEPLVELETDKIDVEVPAPKNGVLERIAQAEGADVKIGDVLGTIAEGQAAEAGRPAPEAPAAATATPADGKAAKPAATKAAPADRVAARSELGPPAPPAKGADGRGVPATPSARKAAREQHVELTAVASEGPRVTRADVARSARSTEAPPTSTSEAPPPGPRPVAASAPAAPRAARAPEAARAVRPRDSGGRIDERVRMSKRRATIARRLVEAQQTAALLTTFNEIDMSAVMTLRERHKEAFKTRHGVGLGIASFFVKAAVAALREVPRLNAEIQGDEMVLKHYYDIGVAVSAAEGLVVPVLRDADRLSFAEVELGIRALADKARQGTLTLEDLRGGTFSITNGGVFGSLLSTPILNPPEVGILGLHAIKERAVGVDGQVVLRPMMYVALTYDHRIVDGAEAVTFLVRVKQFIEDPGVLLIEG